MSNDNYNQQDPEYIAWLKSKQQRIEPEQQHYRPSGGQQPARPQTTDNNGQGWDKSIQQGEVFRSFQRARKNRDGSSVGDGQLRLVVKEFKGKKFAALENWKVHTDDVSRALGSQKHVWHGAASIRIRELREVGNAILELAEQLDGGEVK